MDRQEVLVVGAGPVGLTMAAELARHGVSCCIIDQNEAPIQDTRAAALHARTLEIFENMGILSDVLKEGVKVTGINLYSKKRQLIHTKYKGLDTPYSFIIDLPQWQTEQILIKHLEELGVRIQRNTTLTHLEIKEDKVNVVLKSEEGLIPTHFSYVIGCDGARSTCRHLAEIPFPGSEYSSKWIVFDAKVEWPFDSHEMQLFLHEKGVAAFFPLPHKRMRVTCEMHLAKNAEEPPTLTLDYVLPILRERLGADIEIKESSSINSFIIHHRQAASYREGRLFLAGDAAHLHSPAGGQGMNTGIQDAYNLAWKLALVMKGAANEMLLGTYQAERYPVAREVLSLTDHMTKVVTLKNPFLSFIRDTLLTFVGKCEFIKKQFPKRLSELYIRYAPNQILVQKTKKHPPKKIFVGERAPDHLLHAGGLNRRLFELFKGAHHTLLLFTGKSPNKNDLKSLKTFYSFDHPYIQTLILNASQDELADCPCQKKHSLDLEPSLHSHYGITHPTAVLIRPDGYISLILEPLDKKYLEQHLRKLFN